MQHFHIRGVVRNGQVVPDSPLDLPDGTLVSITEYDPDEVATVGPDPDDPKAREKFLEPQESKDALAHVRTALDGLPEPWTVSRVEEALRGIAEQTGLKPKSIFQPLRVALTGTTVSPGIFETVALLGRAETLARLGHALEA